MTLTLQQLRSTFPQAAVIISGDRNDLSMEKLKSIDPSLRQTVQKGTRGLNILTVVLTDLEVFFEEPVIVEPNDVDEPGKGGVPSDHHGIVVAPRSDPNKPVNRTKIVRTIRPIPSSSLNNIGQVLTFHSFMFI